MKFILNADQEALRDGIRALCSGRFTSERVREGFAPETWKELAEAGVFSLPDLGFGLPEESIVFEELGRALVPGPLVWGALAHSSEQVVTGIDDGVVAHMDLAEVVYAITEEGVLAIGTAPAEPVARPLDPLTPLHSVSGWFGGFGTEFDSAVWHRDGAILTASFLVGIAGACTDAAVAYANEREQFDQPIGKFQSIKHLLADCLVRADVARAAVHAAAVEPSARSASVAKVLAGDAAIANAKTSLQVHGGMGYTWEVDVHLYLKRAWLLDRQFGSSDAHARALST